MSITSVDFVYLSESIEIFYFFQVLSNTYNLSIAAVRTLVKDSGQKLPSKYNTKYSNTETNKRPPSQPNMAASNPGQIPHNSNSNDDTITLYPATDDHTPPAQVVRHGQLLVTDQGKKSELESKIRIFVEFHEIFIRKRQTFKFVLKMAGNFNLRDFNGSK